MNVFSFFITACAGVAVSTAAVAEPSGQGLVHNIDLAKMMPVRESGVSGRGRSAARPQPAAIAAVRPGFVMCGSLLAGDLINGQSAKKPYGIYSATFTPGEAPEVKNIALDSRLNATTGAVMTPEGYFVISTTPYMGYYLVDHYLFDPEDWTMISRTAADMETMARSLAYNPVDKRVYGSFANLDGTFSFSSLDIKNGTRKKIVARSEEPYQALAFDESGTLFGINTEGSLVSINISDGSETLLYALSLPSAYTTSATYDASSGSLIYVQAREDGSELYSIDPVTGSVVSLGEFANNEQWGGIYIPSAEASENAPAAATDIATDFGGGLLSGTVAFNSPTTLFGGGEIEGEMRWTLKANGETLGEGTCSPGERIETAVEVAEAGVYVFTVIISNEAGESPAASRTVAVGPDVPLMSDVPLLSKDNDNGQLQLRWEAPSVGVSGGYVNTSTLTYDIIRYPGGEKAAEGIAATMWSEPAPEGEALRVVSYGVVAVNEGRRSEEILSNPLALGKISLPYEVDFRAPGVLDAFHIVDANGDGITWTPDEKHSAYVDYSSQAMNDWLISAPVELKRGMVYTVTIDAWSQSVRHDERIALWIGQGMESADMTKRLVSRTLDGHPAPFQVQVTVDKDGEYNFGIQGCSPSGQYILRLGSVSISEPVAQTAPEAPRILSLVPDEEGALKVAGRILLPVKASDGSMLGSLTGFSVSRGEEEILNMEKVLPGQIVSFNDEVKKAGLYRYSMKASSEAGVGVTGYMDVYVGVNVPSNPDKREIEMLGGDSYRLSWQPVAKDIDGRTLNTKKLTYHIYDKNCRELGSLDDNFFTLPAPDNLVYPQSDMYYVKAATSAGINDSWTATSGVIDMKVANDGVLRMPLYEMLNRGIGISTDEEEQPGGTNPWRYVDENSGGDSGYIVGESLKDGGKMALVLPPVTVGENSAELKLRCDKAEESDEVEVYIHSNGIVGAVGEEYITTPDDGTITADLSGYAGQTVNAIIVTDGRTLGIREIRLECVVPTDIRIEATAPAEHTYGKVPVGIEVRNAGSRNAERVPLYLDRLLIGESGESHWQQIESFEIASLPTGETAKRDLRVEFPRYGGERLYLRARLGEIAGNDGRDGESREIDVSYADRGYPAARQTEGQLKESLTAVDLKWERPEGLDADGLPHEGESREKLSGYKIYAGSMLLGATDAAVTTYRDELEGDRLPSRDTLVEYSVVACYGDEESEPGESAPVMILKAELIAGGADAMRAEYVGGEILLYGAQGDVEVYTPDGKRVARLSANTDVESPLRMKAERGIYIVSDGKTTLRLSL